MKEQNHCYLFFFALSIVPFWTERKCVCYIFFPLPYFLNPPFFSASVVVTARHGKEKGKGKPKNSLHLLRISGAFFFFLSFFFLFNVALLLLTITT